MLKIRDWFIDIYRVWRHEFHNVFRDPGVMIFFLLLPVMYPIIYTLIYNPELVREVPVVVVDFDRSPESREYVRSLDASEYVKIIGYAADKIEARRALWEKKCYGVLEIPRDFAESLNRGESAQVDMYADMSLLVQYKGLLTAISDVTAAMGGHLKTSNAPDLMGAMMHSGNPHPCAPAEPHPRHRDARSRQTREIESDRAPGAYRNPHRHRTHHDRSGAMLLHNLQHHVGFRPLLHPAFLQPPAGRQLCRGEHFRNPVPPLDNILWDDSATPRSRARRRIPPRGVLLGDIHLPRRLHMAPVCRSRILESDGLARAIHLGSARLYPHQQQRSVARRSIRLLPRLVDSHHRLLPHRLHHSPPQKAHIVLQIYPFLFFRFIRFSNKSLFYYISNSYKINLEIWRKIVWKFGAYLLLFRIFMQ